MVMQFEYPRNALLDLSPINDAIDFRAKQQQRAKDNAYRDEQLGMQKEEFGLKKQGMEDARQKAFVQKAAGIAQMISQEKDPNVASARWGQLVNSDPRWGNALKASGVDPNDFRTGAQMIIAEARGYQDPLDVDLKKAQIAKLQREAATGDNPAAVREWQFFSKLDPAAQDRYLTLKRSDKYLDTGTAFVRPSQVDPTAPPVASVPKNVAEEARLKKVGTETGELQAGAPKAEASLRAADAKSDIVLSTIAEAKQMVGTLTAGFSGSLLSNIPGSGARDLRAKLDTLKANAGFAELQAMRDNSPTGGALGQVAVQELAMLQATITSLEQAQTPAQLSKALDDYEKFVRESKVRRKQAYDATYGAVRQPQQGAGGGGTSSPIPSGNYRFNPSTGQLEPR